MTGIAIDTAGDVLSVALAREKEMHHFEVDAGLRHSERLMELVDALVKEARIEPEALDFAACMKGPGSFTGLRIGMAAVKGLSAALDIPFYALSTFECMAAARSSWQGPVLPIIDAKQGRWYAAAFSGGARLCEDMDADAASIAEVLRDSGSAAILLCGADAPKAREAIAPLLPNAVLIVDRMNRRGSAPELAAAAAAKASSGAPGDNDDTGLHYLRKSEAEITRELKTRER